MIDRTIERVVDLVDPAVNRIHNMSVEEARARGGAGLAGRCAGDRRLLRARRARGGSRAAGAVARPAAPVFSRQAQRGPGARGVGPHRRDPRVSPGRRACRPVSSELHAHGAGPPRRRGPPGGMSRPGRRLHAILHAGARHGAGGAGGAREAIRRGPGRRDRQVAREPSRIGAHRRLLLRRRGQRGGLPRHVSPPRKTRRQSRAFEGVHAVARRRRGPGPGAAFPGGARSRDVPRADRGGPRRSRPLRGRARDGGLQAARRRVRGDGPRALPRNPGALPAMAISPRRRRRRREPEGLSDRGEPGADDPERRSPTRSSTRRGGASAG